MNFLFCILEIILFTISKCDEDLIVELINPYGRIRGHTLMTETGKEYYAFQEIPYAMPPIGQRRLSAPAKHGKWNKILDTTQNTKICMQAMDENPFNLNVTEDCLYLNVYIPRLPTENGNLSTLIWIHPGDFMTGAGVYQYYNPEYLIEYDIIVVTLNYRLGLFGFLWAGDEVIPGNLGLRDQLFAYLWLYDNIKAFGGDPSRLAFVGQGSGAASISYHYINNKKRATRFNCAILQSGSSLSSKYYQPDPLKYAKKVAKIVDPNFNSSSESVGKGFKDLLQQIPEAELLRISEEIFNAEKGKGEFEKLPVIEGYMFSNPYLVYPMLQSWSDGSIRIVQTMIGFNSGEMSSWASRHNLTALAKQYDQDTGLLINSRLNIPLEKRAMAGKELRSIYTDKTFGEDHAALIKYLNDQVVIPIIKQAYNSTWYNTNYIYQFSYKSISEDQEKGTGVNFAENVSNGEELKYFWVSGYYADRIKFSPADRLTQKLLLKLWTNFIKYQNPTPDNSDVLNGAKWTPTEDYEYDIRYLNIGHFIKNGTNPITFQKINDLMDKYIEEPLVVF